LAVSLIVVISCIDDDMSVHASFFLIVKQLILR
jgi:hypothetical protein